eukprot:TRINITY_DN4169_c0_g1_i2.p1 TRINITY_DN4169_c0_g1~~TRINITY_DN4169_c0_g1_i2.p1  ORF type:complete len:1279 (-),score=349.62 TRINITY_DN4169_c0_g1_i2:994-4830(-)
MRLLSLVFFLGCFFPFVLGDETVTTPVVTLPAAPSAPNATSPPIPSAPSLDLGQEFMKQIAMGNTEVVFYLASGDYNSKSYTFSGATCNSSCSIHLYASPNQTVSFNNVSLSFDNLEIIEIDGINFNFGDGDAKSFINFSFNTSLAFINRCSFNSSSTNYALSYWAISSSARILSITNTSSFGSSLLNASGNFIFLESVINVDNSTLPSLRASFRAYATITNSTFERGINNWKSNDALQFNGEVEGSYMSIVDSSFIGHRTAIVDSGYIEVLSLMNSVFIDNYPSINTTSLYTQIEACQWIGDPFIYVRGDDPVLFISHSEFGDYPPTIDGSALVVLSVTHSRMGLPLRYPTVLDTFAFSHNNLSGSPDGFGIHIPWDDLRVLEIEHNQFEGPVQIFRPPKYVTNPKLKIVSYRGNDFVGDFPSEFFEYYNLTRLDLRDNRININTYNSQSVPTTLDECNFDKAFECDYPLPTSEGDRCSTSCSFERSNFTETTTEIPTVVETTTPLVTTEVAETTTVVPTSTSSPTETTTNTEVETTTEIPTVVETTAIVSTSTSSPTETVTTESVSTLIIHPTSTSSPTVTETESPVTTSVPETENPTTQLPTTVTETTTFPPISSQSTSFPTTSLISTTFPPTPTTFPPTVKEDFHRNLQRVQESIQNKTGDYNEIFDGLMDEVLNGTFVSPSPLDFCNDLCSLALKIPDSEHSIQSVSRLCNSTILNSNKNITLDTVQVILTSLSVAASTQINPSQTFFSSLELTSNKILEVSNASLFVIEVPLLSLSSFRLDSKDPSVVEFSFQNSSSSFILPSSVQLGASNAVFSVLKFDPFKNLSNGTQVLHLLTDVTGLSLLNSKGERIEVKDSKENITIQMKSNEELSKSENYTCLYWDEKAFLWKSDGCFTRVHFENASITCLCNHLTNFTVSKIHRSAEDNNYGEKGKMSQGTVVAVVIIACVVGFVLIVIAVVAIIILIKRRRKTDKKITMLEMSLLPTEFIPIHNIQIQEKIANGNYGVVYKGLYHNSTAVTLKKLGRVEVMLPFVKEGNLMRMLHHPHIIQFLGFYQDSESAMFMVFEYMARGSLLSLLTSEGDHLTISQLLCIARDVAAGLTYLEENSIVHGNISARNIMVRAEDDGFHAKISDFASARQILTNTSVSGNSETSNVSVRWNSPEVLSSGEFSHKSDVWSFAVLLFEMSSGGMVPFQSMNNEEVIEYVKTGGHVEVDRSWPEEIQQTAKKCFSFYPSSRPSFSNLYRNIPLSINVKPISRPIQELQRSPTYEEQ